MEKFKKKKNKSGRKEEVEIRGNMMTRTYHRTRLPTAIIEQPVTRNINKKAKRRRRQNRSARNTEKENWGSFRKGRTHTSNNIVPIYYRIVNIIRENGLGWWWVEVERNRINKNPSSAPVWPYRRDYNKQHTTHTHRNNNGISLAFFLCFFFHLIGRSNNFIFFFIL
jgi:hypothetical protein